MKKFILGFVLGAAIFACTTVFAEVAKVSTNNFPILLWGSPIDIEAYNINDHTYIKLTDVSRIFGVPVAFEDTTVHIGDLNKTNTAYYMPDYSSVPNLEPSIEFPPSSIVIEGDHNRIAYYYKLVDKKSKDTLAKFEEILQNDGFQKVADINAKLDFQSKPTGNDVVYNKSSIYVSIEDGGLDDSLLQCVIIRMANTTELIT